MQLANSKSRYGAAPQIIHWLTALCVVLGWLLGQFGDDLPKGPVRAAGLFTHMTLGQCVFVLLIARWAWRCICTAPITRTSSITTTTRPSP